MNLKETFAANLKQLRKQRGMTQETLAELADVAPRHISFIETARSFPSSELLEKFCKILMVSYKDMFCDNEKLSRQELLERVINISENLDIEKLNYIYRIIKEL
ncbi:MAG: helix-turn-helix domain-containing protein [Muribaculaceae bacterium]|nr:helix-turn-helix domain-containing protein [Muribaculaceae bacterium]